MWRWGSGGGGGGGETDMANHYPIGWANYLQTKFNQTDNHVILTDDSQHDSHNCWSLKDHVT